MALSRSTGRAGAWLLGALLAGALAGCGQEITGTSATTGRDALAFVEAPSGLPPVYLNEPYTAPVTVAGGAGPYTVRATGGTLPPGINLKGQQLVGTPTKTGTYTFTLEVTDSTLSTRSKTVTLTVQDLPPLSLALNLPAGQIRGETRIPLTINAPRAVRAARFGWELPAGVTVTRVQPEGSNVVFWRQEGRRVLVDIGFKAVPRTAARVALLTVKPTAMVTLASPVLAYEGRDGEGKLLAQKLFPDEEKKLAEQKAAEQKAAEQKAAEQKAAEQQAAPAVTPTTTPTGTSGTTPAAPAPTTPAPTVPVTSPAPVTPPPAAPGDQK
ncbi:cell ssuface protein containing Ig-like domain protein [Deinococcus sp. HMF7620]|uniref:Cell ssuface protein containing Ig-like domain protein n=1 Tax=Deinococcus arboris TaxID=2682977 RepID=A0A7C9HZR5_9DEIO|nr:Ig domain-containing protein [Deinococcus arboris]MVN87315.1 cell ssuface protein containing Ig-like domain protein [Deinococcus arboris]